MLVDFIENTEMGSRADGRRVDFKVFAVMCAVAEQMSQLHPSMRKMMHNSDMISIKEKLTMARDWYVRASIL
jgi:hypothetical protein